MCQECLNYRGMTGAVRPIFHKVTKAMKKAAHAKCNGQCYYCGIELPDHPYGMDGVLEHVVPTSKGGTDDLSNLVWACPRCNVAKGTKSAQEFLASPFVINRRKEVAALK